MPLVARVVRGKPGPVTVAVLGANLDARHAVATVDVLNNVRGLDGLRELARATTEVVGRRRPHHAMEISNLLAPTGHRNDN